MIVSLLSLALAQSEPEVSAEEPAVQGVWVAAAGFPGPKLDRVVRQAQRLGADVEPVSANIRCLRFPEVPDELWLERSGRRLGIPLEHRANCSVARYPEGEGWWLAVMASAPELEERIEASLGPLGMSVLAQPMDGRPSSLCVSAMQITKARLHEGLQQGGLAVEGVFTVGSCTARVHTLPLRP
mgnify:CR=1 FL=1